jgi:hypothetical protein
MAGSFRQAMMGPGDSFGGSSGNLKAGELKSSTTPKFLKSGKGGSLKKGSPAEEKSETKSQEKKEVKAGKQLPFSSQGNSGKKGGGKK